MAIKNTKKQGFPNNKVKKHSNFNSFPIKNTGFAPKRSKIKPKKLSKTILDKRLTDITIESCSGNSPFALKKGTNTQQIGAEFKNPNKHVDSVK